MTVDTEPFSPKVEPLARAAGRQVEIIRAWSRVRFVARRRRRRSSRPVAPRPVAISNNVAGSGTGAGAVTVAEYSAEKPGAASMNAPPANGSSFQNSADRTNRPLLMNPAGASASHVN